MSDDEMISVGRPLPRIEWAEPLAKHLIALRWQHAIAPIVINVEPALATRRGFSHVREDANLFSTLKVSEYGDSIEWADGSELSAVWLERLAETALDNAGFRAAMDEMELSLDAMAAQLGVGRRLIADYRKNKPIPRHIALATRYLLHERKAG